MAAKNIDVRESFLYAWNLILKNPVIILYTVGVYAVSFAVSSILSEIFQVGPNEQNFFVSFLSTFLTSFVWVGYLQVLIRLAEGKKIEVNQLFIKDYKLAFFYAVGIYAYVLAVIVGLVALIVPGIIVGVGLSMWTYILITHNKMHILDAFKKSWEITKGNRLKIFYMALVSLVVVIAGLLALIVGIFVAIPVIYLAFIHVYKKLLPAK